MENEKETKQLIEKITATIWENNNEKLEEILETNKGLNLNVYNQYHLTPLSEAIFRNNFEMVDMILNHPSIDIHVEENEICFVKALEKSTQEKILEKLLTAGFDINFSTKDEHKVTPLYAAISSTIDNNRDEFVKKLISLGARINSISKDNLTPLHKAILMKKIDLVKILISSGADVTIKAYNLYTPFMLAMKHNIYEAAKELYDKDEIFGDLWDEKIQSLNSPFDDFTLPLALMERMVSMNYNIDAVVENDPNYLVLSMNDEKLFGKVWASLKNKLMLTDPSLLFLYDRCFRVEEIYNWKPLISSKDFARCIQIILTSDVAFKMVESNEYVIQSMGRGPQSFLRKLKFLFQLLKIEKNDRVKILELILQFKICTFEEHVFEFYEKYDFDKELEVIISARNLKLIDSVYTTSNGVLLIKFIFNFGLHPDKVVLDSLKHEPLLSNFPYHSYSTIEFHLLTILKILNFCTPNKSIKEEYFCRVTDILNKTKHKPIEDLIYLINKRMVEMNIVPSLIEISRNATRIFIYNNVQIKKSYYYQNYLNKLNLPDRIKNIIKFKQVLY